MIALLSGEVAVRRSDYVVISCGGVGYRLTVSTETLRHVPAVGHEVTLHSHLIVRDDALALYGFATEEERDLFLMLLGVQSVGPKVAIAVLCGGPPRELFKALAAGDAARFQAVQGIGKRTAERIIVELREKVGATLVGIAGSEALGGDGSAITVSRTDDPLQVAREGLLGLGYSAPEVDRLLSGAVGETAEALISHALKEAARR